MEKKTFKAVQWTLLLLVVAAFAAGCYWYGPRRHWRPGWRDGGGWHGGYYYR